MMKFDQLPHAVLMIEPARFGFNDETASSNAFQQNVIGSSIDIAQLAIREFNQMVDLLRSHDIDVNVIKDTPEPAKPDALFPNNWISFHATGEVILYPMMAPNRRRERRPDIIDTLRADYQISAVHDLSYFEGESMFLEGTGSVVFDHVNKVIFACRSPRMHEVPLKKLASVLGYRPLVFNAVDEQGIPVYHTNVMMSVGNGFAVICLDAVHSDADQDALLNFFELSGTKVVAISYAQMRSFAGNMITVKTRSGEPMVLLSQTAFRSLIPGQINEITRHAELLPINIETIEKLGGGSVRCMVAGIHLPGKTMA